MAKPDRNEELRRIAEKIDSATRSEPYEFPEINYYPFWVKQDPLFAKEHLAAIRHKLRTGETLTQQDRDYLTEAIEKILQGLSAEKALCLVARKGRKRETFCERNILIYSRVLELVGQGLSKRRAYLDVAIEQSNAGPKGRPLTESAIEKIYGAIAKELKKSGLPKQIRQLV